MESEVSFAKLYEIMAMYPLADRRDYALKKKERKTSYLGRQTRDSVAFVGTSDIYRDRNDHWMLIAGYRIKGYP